MHILKLINIELIFSPVLYWQLSLESQTLRIWQRKMRASPDFFFKDFLFPP